MDKGQMYRISKSFLLVTNTLFEACGLLAITLGVYCILTSSHLDTFTSAMLIVAGLFTGMISSLGYLGAHKENSKLLNVYAIIVLLLLFLKAISFICLMLTPAHHPKDSDIKQAFDYYDKEPTITANIDNIQSAYLCCGYDDPKSLQRIDGSYPTSCCANTQTTCFHPHTDGCVSKMLEKLNSTLIISRVSICVGFVLHLLCLVAAFYMSNSIETKAQVSFQYSNF